MIEYISFTDKEALKYLRAFGLTESESSQFLTKVRDWERNSGVEWTIKRLKSLKVAYIRMLGGLDPWTYTPWVARDLRKKKLPKGPVGRIFRLPKAQAIGCLMIYTMWTAKRATTNQLDKFISGVESKKLDPYTSSEIREILKDVPLNNVLSKPYKTYFSKLSAWYTRETRVPRFSDESFTKVKSVPNSLEVLLETASHPLATQFMRDLNRTGELPEFLYNVYAKAVGEPVNVDYDDLERNVVGSIGFIQEPGFKLRTIANPFPIFQVLLSRLGNRVYDMLKSIPEDCTFDQERGIYEIQNALKSGVELVAFDLSSATDRFPAELTFKLLEILKFKERDIQLFRDLSRGLWTLPSGEEISWTNGQPLGVYPSFGAFALSHHLVIQSLKPEFYRILGDDLVISKECYARALALYAHLGVPISMDKSIDSPLLTEFGGRIITSTEIISQPKWRVISDRSFIDLAKSLGPRVFHLLRPRQARLVHLLAQIPSDVSPYGLNWNPKGLPYRERLELCKTTIELLQSQHLELKGDSLSTNNRLLFERSTLLLSQFPLSYFDELKEENNASNWGDRLSSDTKTRVLAHANIRYIKVSDDEDDESLSLYSTWFSNCDSSGDIRGRSLLENLEKKLFSKPKHR